MTEYFDPEAWLATGYALLLLVIAAGLASISTRNN